MRSQAFSVSSCAPEPEGAWLACWFGRLRRVLVTKQAGKHVEHYPAHSSMSLPRSARLMRQHGLVDTPPPQCIGRGTSRRGVAAGSGAQNVTAAQPAAFPRTHLHQQVVEPIAKAKLVQLHHGLQLLPRQCFWSRELMYVCEGRHDNAVTYICCLA